MKETITIEKEVFEAVLRNSVKVADLDAENQKLKELLKECREVVKNYNFFVMGTLPKESDLITKIDKVLK
jgi:hypothetical protein